jgi:Flp pilus assembly protein TadG
MTGAVMRIPRIPRRFRNQRGGTVLEMAIAGPLFFILMFGITEFGRAVWLYSTLSHASREAARFAIVRGAESGRAVSETDVETFVQNRAPGLQDADVTTTWEPNNLAGSVVEVQVQTTFEPVVGIIPSIPMSSTSRLVISF